MIPDIVARHAEEAAVLWLIRDRAVSRSQNSLRQLAELDQRVEAHIDGLRVAGAAGWEICLEAMAEGGAGEVFAVAVLAFGEGDAAKVQQVLALGEATAGSARAVVSALGWLPPGQAAQHITTLLASGSSAHRRVGIAAAAAHRQAPHQEVIAALGDADPLVRARACRAVGELGLVGLHRDVCRNLQVEDESCRFWAAWATTLIVGDQDGLAGLRAAAEGTEDVAAEKALQVAMRRMEPARAEVWQREMALNPGLSRRAVIGAGIIGVPELIPWLIEQMEAPPLARVAGEAFSMTTGADIVAEKLDAEQPEGIEAGPTEDPEDEDVSLDPDEDLPWPDPKAIRTWWDRHRTGFTRGARHLLGRPLSPGSLQHALRTGRQNQRAAAALELAMRQRGQPLFAVKAPGFRQQRLLKEAP